MDNSIRPEGWTPFDSARYALAIDFYIYISLYLLTPRPVIMNTTFYAEFNSMGKRYFDVVRIPRSNIY